MVHSPKDYLNVIIVFIIGSVIAFACSIGALSFKGLPIIVCCMLISFIVHWLAFIPSYALRTEKYYDICGTFAYVCVLLTALYLTTSASENSLHTRSILAIVLVLTWALRLGFFLFVRVLKAGEDRRFREVKQKFSGFLVWWTISALWVFLTTVNALVMIINNVSYHSDYYFYFGLVVWIAGFSFEVIADEQKRRFRSQSSNKEQFISTGLWSISRHPNYFGEILLWIGMAVIAFPTLQGWQHISLISPIFIYLLLTRMSGVNLLEKYADEKWGDDENYQNYKRDTPVIIPFLK
jgi:steroid 5-alpha reductase family enzyme|tara:strand:- start:120 stop:1001 length:882 start_codon:yes stop_codon:yes gene_type:complete